MYTYWLNGFDTPSEISFTMVTPCGNIANCASLLVSCCSLSLNNKAPAILSLVLFTVEVSPINPGGVLVLTKSALRIVIVVAVWVAPTPKKAVSGLSIAIFVT